ncbi:hypothetical protein K504DRAFT_384788 [Pleomassaria siparia CBS 279.74]|uniref:ADP-ribosylation factor n=1 Tax=Pleomassaria siparia CBS 279.74 TaxID=1314801 RepID=A0A6G1K1Z8_9PLEO|nr:hypothetical protein K504DRAFT_384788 [Pleomassaria siparia CBS 279.74]
MNGPFRPTSPPEELPAYYNDLHDDDITAAFRDFDQDRNYDLFDRQTRNPNSSNFIIDFGDDDAWCAFDLGSSSISRLLNSPRPALMHTRWINIWLPYNQKDTLHVLAKHYDFSPRLLGLMCSDPVPPKKTPLHSKKSSATLRSRKSNKSHKSQQSQSSSSKDKSLHLEESIGMTELMHSTQLEMVRDMSHYHIVDEVWHWSSVDWGRHFVCLGYNTLHNVRTRGPTAHNDELDNSQDTPHGKRVWNWLLLCEDQTVISISEDPFPYIEGGRLQAHELRTLYTIRRNLVSVFRQLTKSPTPFRESSLIMLPIRHRIGNSEEETAHRPTDTPGLLFYYLFEDWFTTYSLVTRREHGYAAELDRLRREMLVKANLTHIDQLHHIGCQLSILKRVYQSYELIIARVLKKQEATLASLKNSHVLSAADSLASSLPLGSLQVAEADSLLGVSISSTARVRFERLKDRIKLYALSEIEECIAQKDSLVMMNFNLIAIKESFSVERLTRVTLLLAKVTLVFMPVTLMTGYFSIQFSGVEFQVKSYWWSFAVILGVSLVLLFLFSLVSGSFEGKIITRPLSRMVVDFGRRKVVGRRWKTG